MTDSRYTYEKVNAIKIIVENTEGKILLIKEPDTNEWMPGHWGLPGGKTLVKESLLEAFKRKMQGDLGIDLNPKGLFKIEELLMDGKTAMMYHAVAVLDHPIEINGEIAGFKWVGKDELEKMDLTEFTEYFNRKLLIEYLEGKRGLIGFDLIETQPYYEFEANTEYQRWRSSGERKK